IIGNPSLNHRYRKGFYSLFKTLQQNLREYVEEVDNPGDDWYTTLTDFLDTYTYDDTEEIQNELDRKRMPYQRFERKKGQ
ncbi:hypothetical protein FVD46_13840, partial [Enterococcus faecium]|nr:hypothetical protein [Enterococcus faecium]